MGSVQNFIIENFTRTILFGSSVVPDLKMITSIIVPSPVR